MINWFAVHIYFWTHVLQDSVCPIVGHWMYYWIGNYNVDYEHMIMSAYLTWQYWFTPDSNIHVHYFSVL